MEKSSLSSAILTGLPIFSRFSSFSGGPQYLRGTGCPKCTEKNPESFKSVIFAPKENGPEFYEA